MNIREKFVVIGLLTALIGIVTLAGLSWLPIEAIIESKYPLVVAALLTAVGAIVSLIAILTTPTS